MAGQPVADDPAPALANLAAPTAPGGTAHWQPIQSSPFLKHNI